MNFINTKPLLNNDLKSRIHYQATRISVKKLANWYSRERGISNHGNLI